MMMERTFPLPIDDSFQPPVSELLIRLHRLFREYAHNAAYSDSEWCPEPEEAYDSFLGHLDDAIDALRVYEVKDADTALQHSDDDRIGGVHLTATSTVI